MKNLKADKKSDYMFCSGAMSGVTPNISNWIKVIPLNKNNLPKSGCSDIIAAAKYKKNNELQALNDTNWQSFYDTNSLLEYSTRFIRDELGARSSVTDANGNTTSYEYSQAGQILKEVDPLGNVTSYSYDGNGHLASITDGNGNAISYHYDANGRLLKKTYTDATEETFVYDTGGKLLSAANINISYVFSYDEAGRILTCSNSNGKTIEYAYDTDGKKIRTIYPDGSIIRYGYDSANRLKTVLSPAGSFIYEYDEHGRISSLSYPNWTTTGYRYDANGRVTRLIHTNRFGSVIDSFAYTHDECGNRLSKSEPDRQTTYTYDDACRLLEEAGGSGKEHAAEYCYDATGNRLSGPAPHSVYEYGAGNQLLSTAAAGYCYDNNGNLRKKTIKSHDEHTWNYRYDCDNRLVQAETCQDQKKITVTFKYDPFGRRIEKQVCKTAGHESKTETTRYIYDGPAIVIEENQFGEHGRISRYIHGLHIDEPLAMIRNDQNYFYHADGLGSVAALTDQIGATRQKYTYDAFGNMTRTSDLRQPYGFTGREYDSETGLYYYRARYYDPQIGRFIQRDPISFAGGDWNLYGYVSNDPVNCGDPSGLFQDGRRAQVQSVLEDRVYRKNRMEEHPCVSIDLDEIQERRIFLGHSDFTGGDYFDYTLEDKGATNPMLAINADRHFKPLDNSEFHAQYAFSIGDKELFERAMHRGQDYFSHYNEGYRWDLIKGKWGHLRESVFGDKRGKDPDDHELAWLQAEEWTKPWVTKWYEKWGRK